MNDARHQSLVQLERVAREVAAGLGLEIVEVSFQSRGKHSLLRLDIDRPGVPGAGIRDCEALSRAVDGPLEDLAFFDGSFELQVSTPGIDRPIRTSDDLRRNAGRIVRANVRDDKGGTVEVSGTLLGADESGRVRLATGEGEMTLATEHILLMRQDVGLGGGSRKKR